MLGIGADAQKLRGRPRKAVATMPSIGMLSDAPAQSGPKQRRFSAEARARMSAAQRKRYAGKTTANKPAAPPAAPVTKV